jgi:pimeloyl-ACP methyl ester carboxylesterase
MPYAVANGARLYYEGAGSGVPVVFVHEFSGDLTSWEAQIRCFSRRYRCIAFNARGYPPSDVPASVAEYSWTTAVDDIAAVMRHARAATAHVIGCSMGAYSTLQLGLRYPRLARSLTLVGAGAGSHPAQRAQFLKNTIATAQRFEHQGLEPVMQTYRFAANRIQLDNKDPRGFADFFRRFSSHSALGHANTLRGVQLHRPSIYGLARGLARLKVPLHVVAGDEDDGSLGPALFLKRACSAARLSIVPATGHVVNVEEPAYFNRITDEFLALVDAGRWRPRDPRSLNRSTMARKA